MNVEEKSIIDTFGGLDLNTKEGKELCYQTLWDCLDQYDTDGAKHVASHLSDSKKDEFVMHYLLSYMFTNMDGIMGGRLQALNYSIEATNYTIVAPSGEKYVVRFDKADKAPVKPKPEVVKQLNFTDD